MMATEPPRPVIGNAYTRFKSKPPVEPKLTAYEAEVVLDVLEPRLLTMQVVDREDIRTQTALRSAIDKIRRARGAAL